MGVATSGGKQQQGRKDAAMNRHLRDPRRPPAVLGEAQAQKALLSGSELGGARTGATREGFRRVARIFPTRVAGPRLAVSHADG